MEPDRDAFLAAPHIAVVATTDGSGPPHLSPVWYEWDGTRFTFRFEPQARKLRHLATNPAITVLVDRRTYPYRKVSADCVAEIGETLPGWPESLARRYLAGDNLRAFLDAYAEEPCVVVRATPHRWYGK